MEGCRSDLVAVHKRDKHGLCPLQETRCVEKIEAYADSLLSLASNALTGTCASATGRCCRALPVRLAIFGPLSESGTGSYAVSSGPSMGGIDWVSPLHAVNVILQNQ